MKYYKFVSVNDEILKLSKIYSSNLKSKIDERVLAMEQDDRSHYILYNVLGVSAKEGDLVDLYQNKGRFLYKYAGSFLEEAAILCFKNKFPSCESKLKIGNTVSSRPKTFEIDCLVNGKAYEIKWRDATTDGDHIAKEHSRIKAIKAAGYMPIRLMFFEPNRSQAQQIQQRLKLVYRDVGGLYMAGSEAWAYLKEQTDVDLLSILNSLVLER